MENKDIMRMMSPPAGQVMPQFLMQNPSLASGPNRNLVDPSLMAAALSHAQMAAGTMMVNPFMKDVKDMMSTHHHPASQAVAQLSQESRRLSDGPQSGIPDHLRMGGIPQSSGHPYTMQQHLSTSSHHYMIHGGIDSVAGSREPGPPVSREMGQNDSGNQMSYPLNMAQERGQQGGLQREGMNFEPLQRSFGQDGRPEGQPPNSAASQEQKDAGSQNIKAQTMPETGNGNQGAGPSKSAPPDTSGPGPSYTSGQGPASAPPQTGETAERGNQKQPGGGRKSEQQGGDGKGGVHNLPVKVEPVFDQYTLNALASLAEAQARVQQSLLNTGAAGGQPGSPGSQPACSSDVSSAPSTMTQTPSTKSSGSSTKTKKSPTKYYPCLECEKVFQRPEKLREHEMQHTGLRPYQCETCPKAYTNAHRLKVHSWSHAGLKPYKCTLCQKEFSKSDKLRRHEQTHTDVRPFNCSFCNRAFRRKDHVQNHERIHTGIKPHSCKHCDKSFARIDHCRKHEKTHFHVRNATATVKVESQTQTSTQTGTQTDDIIDVDQTAGPSTSTLNTSALGPTPTTSASLSTDSTVSVSSSGNLCSAALQSLASGQRAQQHQGLNTDPNVKMETLNETFSGQPAGSGVPLQGAPYQRGAPPQGITIENPPNRMQFFPQEGANGNNVNMPSDSMIPFRSQIVFPSGIPVTGPVTGGSSFTPPAPSGSIPRNYSPLRH